MRLSPVQTLSKANLPKTRFVFLLDCFTREDRSIGAENLCTEGASFGGFRTPDLVVSNNGPNVGFEGGVSPLRRLLPQYVSVAELHKTKLKQISMHVFGAAPFGGLSIAENCHCPYAGGYFHFTLY